jgi:hypothetical protein
LVLGLVLGSMAVGARPVVAGLIYTTTDIITDNGDELDQFGTLDTSTGHFTSIGTLNVDGPIFALGYGSDNNVYGISALGTLYQINQATAATTDLGSVGHDSIGGESINGTLYVMSLDSPAILFKVNPPSPVSTDIGPMTGFLGNGLLATSPGGATFASGVANETDPSDGLYSVDITTGAVSRIGDLGTFVSAGLFLGGTLYGISGNTILTIDTGTGATTTVATADVSADTLFAGAVAIRSVPEGSSLAMLAIGIGMVAVAGPVVGRRRRSE